MAKQEALIEGLGIQELDDAASALKETRAQRMSLLKEEIQLADNLLELMQKNGKTDYHTSDGYDVKVVPGKAKVKVRSPKDGAEEEEQD